MLVPSVKMPNLGSGANGIGFPTLSPMSTSMPGVTNANNSQGQSNDFFTNFLNPVRSAVSTGESNLALSPHVSMPKAQSGATQSDANSTGGYAAPYSSNTAGGGATASDANSTGFGYNTPDIGQTQSDYIQKLINGDQQLQADLARIGAQQGNYLGQFTGNAQAMEIALGLPIDTTLANSLGFKAGNLTGVNGDQNVSDPLFNALADPTTVAAAKNNQFSSYAQIAQALSKANNAYDASAVARGMGNSGAYQDANGNYLGGQHHMDTEMQSQQARYAALQDFLGKLGGGYQTYQDQVSNLLGQKDTVRSNALNRILALINAGALKLPGTGNPTPQPNPLNNQPAAPNPLNGTGITNQQYAQSPTGQDMVKQLLANPNIASSGAAGSLLSGGAAPNYQANKNLANEQSGVQTVPGWMTNGGWGSFGWGGGAAGTSGGDDGSYDQAVNGLTADQWQDPLANAANLASQYITPAVQKQFNLSPNIGVWRT